MSLTRSLAPRHISLPPRVLSLSGYLSSGSSEGGPRSGTLSPHTPAPYESLGSELEEEQIRLAISLDEGSSTGQKRGRELDEPAETDWTDEELETVSSTLRHPFRPLSSPFPPGELPPANILDELTSQILAYALRGSPGGTSTGDGWTHGWDATRRKVYAVALEASRSAHGLEKEKLPRGERVARPGLRRMDSMDFLDQAEGGDNVGTAIRLSTSLQNSAKGASPPPRLPQAVTEYTPSGLSASASSSSAPATASIPALTVSAPPLRKRQSSRNTLNRPTRPTSLLQRGRSYTANELQAEGSVSPQSPKSPAPGLMTDPTSPTALRRPARITRSQSSIISTQPKPHSARDLFLQTSGPKITLDRPVSLEANPKPTGNWSDSEDEDMKPKRTRSTVRKMPARGLSLSSSAPASPSSLQSPFEERNAYI